jgi:alkanesulfonate monooxygenase SsuD/methylene tetrahydromethanopterin reductase-like flavin-dependent oxidoreductase (luciferase family)
LKLILHPRRPDLPIYLAAIGPKNTRLAGRIADGWLPVFFSPDRFDDVYGPMLGERDETFDIAPTVHVVMGDDIDACREVVKPTLALYVGGMGSRGRNFYNDLARRYGFEEEAERIQDLYLSGEKEAAAAAVPDQLVDEVALCGPRKRIAELITRWKDSPVTTMLCSTGNRRALEVVAELVL